MRLQKIINDLIINIINFIIIIIIIIIITKYNQLFNKFLNYAVHIIIWYLFIIK